MFTCAGYAGRAICEAVVKVFDAFSCIWLVACGWSSRWLPLASAPAPSETMSVHTRARPTPSCARDVTDGVSSLHEHKGTTESCCPSCRDIYAELAEPSDPLTKAGFVAFLRSHLCQDEDGLARGKNITVYCSETQDPSSISLQVEQNQELRFTLSVHVSSESTPYVLLQGVLLCPGALVTFDDTADVAAGDKEIMVAPGSSYPIGLKCFSQDTGTFVIPLALTFQQGCSSSKQFTVVQYLEVSCSKNLEDDCSTVASAHLLEDDSPKDARLKDVPVQLLEDAFPKDDCAQLLEDNGSKEASAQLSEDGSPEDAFAEFLEEDVSKVVSAQLSEDDSHEDALAQPLEDDSSKVASAQLAEDDSPEHSFAQLLEEDASKVASAQLSEDDSHEDALAQLLKDDGSKVASAQLSEDDSPEDAFARLLEDDDSKVASAQLSEDDSHEEALAQPLEDDGSKVVSAQLSEDDIPEDALAQLSEDDGSKVASAQLSENDIPEDALAQLLEDDGSKVASAQLSEDDSPEDALAQLLEDDGSKVASAQLSSKEDSPEDAFARLLGDDGSKVASAQLSEDALAQPLGDDGSKVASAQLAEDDSPEDSFAQLLEEDGSKVASAQLSEGDSHEDALAQLLEDDGSKGTSAQLSEDDIPEDAFAQLLEEDGSKVSSARLSEDDSLKDAFAQLLEDDGSKVASAQLSEDDSPEDDVSKVAFAQLSEDDSTKHTTAQLLEDDGSKGTSQPSEDDLWTIAAAFELLKLDSSKSAEAYYFSNSSLEPSKVSCFESTSVEPLKDDWWKNSSVEPRKEDYFKDSSVEHRKIEGSQNGHLKGLGVEYSLNTSLESLEESTPAEHSAVNCLRSSHGYNGIKFNQPTFNVHSSQRNGPPSKVSCFEGTSVEPLKDDWWKKSSFEHWKIEGSQNGHLKDLEVKCSVNTSRESFKENVSNNTPAELPAVDCLRSTHGYNGVKFSRPTFKVHSSQRNGSRHSHWKKSTLPKARCTLDGCVSAKSQSDLEFTMPLGFYPPPEELLALCRHNMERWDGMQEEQAVLLEGLLKCLNSPLSQDNYLKVFSTLLSLEEIKINLDFQKPGKASFLLKPFPNYGGWFFLEVSDSFSGQSSIVVGSEVAVDVYSGQKKLGPQFRGRVMEIRDGMIFFKFSERFQQTYREGMRVDLRFFLNRLPLRLMHRAIVLCKERELWSFVLPKCDEPSEPAVKVDELSFFNRSIATNAEQCSAVKNIVLGLHRPYPFLLFGPPGTGKTVTLVEALNQVCLLIPSSHILVVAPSNSACDVLAEKLLDQLRPSQIFRVYSSSVHRSKMSKKLIDADCANYSTRTGIFYYPSIQDFMKYKVVVATLAGSGKLVSAEFPRNHFTHIFVDEAGQSLEPECLIPVVGLMSSWNPKRKGTGGHLILAGDPLQLGPVVCNHWCRNHGLGMSLLERLMKLPPYQRQADGCYNPRMLSKLIRNFRSHTDILNIPNERFYDGELQACADTRVADCMLQWEGLPCKGCPLLFHAVSGRDLTEDDNPSHFNPEEIQLVVHYVEALLRGSSDLSALREEDIGIVSPYHQQVVKISTVLNKRGHTRISVGSTEQYQGRERLVIIITTVRSDDSCSGRNPLRSLGFLTNQKRFNVAITRAKALLIVIGNPITLGGDPCWGSLLEFCIRKGAYTNVSFNALVESWPKLRSLEHQLSKLVVGDHTANEDDP